MYSIFSNNGLASADFFKINEWTDIYCPAHCHCTVEIIIVTEGTVMIERDGISHTLQENDIIAIMPFETHKFVTVGSSKIVVWEMSTGNVSNFDEIFKNKTLKKPYRRFSSEQTADILELLKASERDPIAKNCVFFTVLRHIMKENELVPSSAPGETFQKVIIYTSAHFDESITLNDVAKALNVSYVYLSRLFTKKTNIKFNEFLNNYRIKKATQLLTDPSITISDVCYACGFGSLRNFNRVFSKMMSCTPTEFRKSHVGAADLT